MSKQFSLVIFTTPSSFVFTQKNEQIGNNLQTLQSSYLSNGLGIIPDFKNETIHYRSL